MELNINWEVFTAEEKQGIEKLLEMRMPEHMAAVIINMDRSKEVELQKIMSQVRPLNDLAENSIRENIIGEYYKKNPRGPQSPAEEKVLQDELDAELAKFHTEQQKKAKEQEQILENAKESSKKIKEPLLNK